MSNICDKLTRRQLNLGKKEFTAVEREDGVQLNRTDDNALERKLNLSALVFLNVSNSVGSGNLMILKS